MKLCGKDFNEFRMYMYNKKAFISRCCMFTVIPTWLTIYFENNSCFMSRQNQWHKKTHDIRFGMDRIIILY